MFISIDHIPNMNLYLNKEFPTEPIMINLSQITNMIPMIIYPKGVRTEITKITQSSYQHLYLPFTWEESLAIIRNSTKVSDFRIGIGDYYVEIRKYLTPADIDKEQFEKLGKS